MGSGRGRGVIVVIEDFNILLWGRVKRRRVSIHVGGKRAECLHRAVGGRRGVMFDLYGLRTTERRYLYVEDTRARILDRL